VPGLLGLDAGALDEFANLAETSSFLYGQQLAQNFVSEIVIALGLIYLLTVLAIELGNGRFKKRLAFESLESAQQVLIRVSAIYSAQLFFGGAVELFNGYRAANCAADRLKFITALAGLFILSNSVRYVDENAQHLLEYAIVRLLSLLFRLLLVSSANLRSAFLAIVGFSLNLYVLIFFDAPTFAARESGVKYYYLSTFSSGLRIYGIFLFFISRKTASFSESAQVISSHLGQPFLLQAGILLLLTGVFFKLSAFPGHL
jgi:NADH:ubiquinone oxidoreductase subunit 2 (subunit N)